VKNILSKLFGLVTHNWGLKLLALALAIVIYHSLKPAGASRQKNDHDRPLFQSR